MDNLTVGSYNLPDSVLGSSPALSPFRIGDGEFSEDSIRRSNSAKFASSLPSAGFDFTAAAAKAVDERKKDLGVSSDGRFQLLLDNCLFNVFISFLISLMNIWFV